MEEEIGVLIPRGIAPVAKNAALFYSGCIQPHLGKPLPSNNNLK
jgi:hypothetical protein